MMTMWSRKGVALAAAVAAGAVLVALLSFAMASSEPISSAALGPEWQCSRVAFVLTTCTRTTGAAAAAIAIPVRAKQPDCASEL
ncbi:hypothetical protein H8A99_20515 [Bradyrhizobium sp. Arg68]|uniref:hypothetical protein n=1 Tax=Bradyrhizobium ivorense TaxID=2511166 RepID=UPI001E4D14EE|nr:hypothetical protein [Bradyrhizobium ivorense]MCC8938796.1 hypothetical protein [Bradyrhizobium ivorense]